MNGTLKWFSADKGYGFILPADGSKDVFVHITAVNDAGLKAEDMKEGVALEYELKEHKGKISATGLRLTA